MTDEIKTPLDKACVVLAGAGTGKSYTIKQKAKYLVEELKYNPKEILCLTFSNEATNSLKKGMQEEINSTEDVDVKTFHAFCADILREEGHLVGVQEGFEILLPDDAKIFMHKYLEIKPYWSNRYINTISTAKDFGISIDDIKGHLNAEDLYQQRSIRFIENHDEEAALTAFGREKSLAAALIISSLRGARLYHILQIYGRQKRVPIQYTGDKGKKDLPILRKYEKILQITNHPAFHGGQWFIMDTFPVQEGDEKHKNFLAWSWVQQNTSKMVVINYSSQKAECVLQCKKCPDEQDGMYVLYEEISGKDVHIPAASMDKGLKLSFEPYQMYILNYNF